MFPRLLSILLCASLIFTSVPWTEAATHIPSPWSLVPGIVNDVPRDEGLETRDCPFESQALSPAALLEIHAELSGGPWVSQYLPARPRRNTHRRSKLYEKRDPWLLWLKAAAETDQNILSSRAFLKPFEEAAQQIQEGLSMTNPMQKSLLEQRQHMLHGFIALFAGIVLQKISDFLGDVRVMEINTWDNGESITLHFIDGLWAKFFFNGHARLIVNLGTRNDGWIQQIRLGQDHDGHRLHMDIAGPPYKPHSTWLHRKPIQDAFGTVTRFRAFLHSFHRQLKTLECAA